MVWVVGRTRWLSPPAKRLLGVPSGDAGVAVAADVVPGSTREDDAATLLA